MSGEAGGARAASRIGVPLAGRCVGRQSEGAWLADRLAEPDGGTVLLLGPPGIGKTTLASSIIIALEGQRCAWHAVRPRASPVSLLGTVALMLGSSGRPRLRSLLRAHAEIRPSAWLVLEDDWPAEETVVVFDDIHLAGPGAGAALVELSERLRGRAATLLLIGRDATSLGPMRGSWSVLRLGPLKSEGSAALLGLGPSQGAELVRLHLATGGAPLLLSLAERALAVGEPAPATVKDAVDRAPPAERGVLLRLALARGPLPESAAAAAASSDAAATVAALEKRSLASRGAGGEVAVHALVAEAVLATARGVEIEEAHRGLALHYSSVEDDPRAAVEALRHSRAAGDPATFGRVLRSLHPADGDLSLAPELAEALDPSPPDALDRDSLRAYEETAARVDEATGRHRLAADGHGRAQTLASEASDWPAFEESAFRRARCLLRAGDRAAAEETATAARARLERTGAPLHRLDSLLATLAVESGRLDRAENLFRGALAGAQARGDEENVATAYNGLGIVSYWRGDSPAMRSNLDLAVRAVGRVESEALRARIETNLGSALLLVGDLAAAEAQLRRAAGALAAMGEMETALPANLNLATTLMVRGVTRETRELVESCLNLAERLGGTVDRAMAVSLAGQVAEILGEYEGARQHYLDAQDGFASAADRFRVAETEHHLCRLALASGDLAGAESHLGRARDPAGAAVIATDVAWDAATLRLAQGRVDDAVAELRGFEKRQPVGDFHGRVRLARVRGRVLEAQGRREEALKRFLWAAEAARGAGAELEEARSLRCAAECAAGLDDREAKRSAAEALRLFEKLSVPERCRRPEL